MLKIENIHHVAIIASDYEKSKEFYTKILGFQIEKETYREESCLLYTSPSPRD